MNVTEGSSSSELLNELPVYTADKELVLWLGCFAKHAMDPNFVSSVRNFVKILESAGVTYGVLSNEQCSGDPANKLGDKLNDKELAASGVTQSYVRLCIGLEHIDDIIDDLDQALNKSSKGSLKAVS